MDLYHGCMNTDSEAGGMELKERSLKRVRKAETANRSGVLGGCARARVTKKPPVSAWPRPFSLSNPFEEMVSCLEETGVAVAFGRDGPLPAEEGWIDIAEVAAHRQVTEDPFATRRSYSGRDCPCK